MKRLFKLLLVAFLGGVVALGSYKLFIDSQPQKDSAPVFANQNWNRQDQQSHTTYVTHPYHGAKASSEAPDFTKAAKKAIPAVVHIKNYKIVKPQSYFEYLRRGRGGRFLRGMGSGVIITPDGYIVTNNHVIEGASELEVTLSNKLTYQAKVVGTYPQADIALLKIEAKNLPYLPFGNSAHVEVGQWVLAVGNPYTLTSTVTAGIVSAKGRNLREGRHRLESFIQTDAAINPGNSGGALINIYGELIGINSAISSSTGSYIGYSFAIPSNYVRKIVEDLIQYGNVKQARLGIEGFTIKAKNVKKYDFPVSQGVHVVSSSFGAQKAGLRKGDLITAVDAKRVEKMSDLAAYIGTKRPGEVVKISYYRNGQERQARVKLSEFVTYALKAAGLEVTDASAAYLKSFSTQNGVRILRSLSPDSPLPEELKDQLIITAIDGHPVNSVKEVKQIMKKKSARERTRITFQNKRGRQETIIF